MGGMNSYEVTGSKLVGIAVALLDFAKGWGVCYGIHAMGADEHTMAYGAVGVVLGHCFNVFFRLRGGRGLATAAGVGMAVNPLPLVLWLLMYGTGYFVIRKDIHVGSVAGTLGLLILTYTVPPALLSMTMLVKPFDPLLLKGVVYMMCIIIFLRHIEPMRQMFASINSEDSDTL